MKTLSKIENFKKCENSEFNQLLHLLNKEVCKYCRYYFNLCDLRKTKLMSVCIYNIIKNKSLDNIMMTREDYYCEDFIPNFKRIVKGDKKWRTEIRKRKNIIKD